MDRLLLKDTITNKIVNTYTYEKLSNSTEDKMKLRNNLERNKNFKLICGCNPDKEIEYRIGVNGQLYPSKTKTIDYHSKTCCKYYISLENKWVEKDDGTIIVRFNYYINTNSMFNIKRLINNISELTLDKLSESVDITTITTTDFIKKVYGTTRKIFINGKLLNDMYYKFYEDKDMEDDEIRFMYMKYISYEQNKFIDGIYNIKCLDSFNKYHTFQCSKEILDNAMLKEINTDGSNLIISGFIRSYKGFNNFTQLSLLQLDNLGR